MITYMQGNLLESKAQTLVNAVNTVGVMGKGIALAFRQAYPEMFTQYKALCASGNFQIGILWLYQSSDRWILNFPTKKHWRNPSRLEYIEAGLQKFIQTYAAMNITSIAFPCLGCGAGGLDWKTQVQPLMERYLNALPIGIEIVDLRFESN